MAATQYHDQPTPIGSLSFSGVPSFPSLVIENLFAANQSPTDTIYLQVHNNGGAFPDPGSVPVYWFPMSPLAQPNFSPPGVSGGAIIGRKFTGTIWIMFSSTPDVLTPGPLAAFWMTWRLVP